MVKRPVTVDASSRPLPKVSVVVPVYNSARTLEGCLQSIRSQEGVVVELIVVDSESGSSDDSPRIASEVADVFLASGKERVAQRNAGLARASHPLVAFVDSDMVLSPSVLAEAAVELEDPACGGVVVDEEIVGTGFLISGRRLEKRLYRGDAAAEAARVFRTGEVRAVGGYDADLEVAEDFDLSDRVVAGRRLGRAASPIFHDEGRIRLRSVWRKKVYYGTLLRGFLSRVVSSDAGPSRASRHRLFRRSLLRIPWALVTNPYAGSALVLIKSVEFTGLAWGALIANRTDVSLRRERAYPPRARTQ